MEHFLQDIYMLIFHEWVSKNSLRDYQSFLKDEGVYFEGKSAEGIVHFWPDHIIEEEIFDLNNKQRIFHLHFQMENIYHVKSLIDEFFDFLIHYKRIEKRILLCCSGAVTTTYFAYEMNELANQLGMPYQIDAVGYYRLDEIIQNYEIVMLAPQVAYLEAQFKRRFHDKKILAIKPKTFATHHYLEALKQIDEEVYHG